MTPVRSRADDALFRPLRTGNAFEETVERLLTAIKLGVVSPGERLPSERELAERLSVSRATLREAIRALERAGYLVCRRGRYGGSFVSLTLPELSRPAGNRSKGELGQDLEDALVLREVLEVGAADQAAARQLNPTEQRQLAAHLAACTSAADLAEYRRRDSRLHVAIAEATGSQSLTSAVATARMRTNALLDAIPVLDRNVKHSDDQHALMVAAILARDRPRARLAASEHAAATAALLRGFLA